MKFSSHWLLCLLALSATSALAQDLGEIKFSQQPPIVLHGEGDAEAGLFPDVAVSPSGKTLAVWSGSFGLFGREISPLGELGDIFRITQEGTQFFPRWPTVCYDGAGAFNVVWEQPDIAGAPWYRNIHLRRFDVNGDALGPDQRINVVTQWDQRQPAIACAPDGRFVVIWRGPGNGVWNVVGRLFSSEGIPLTDDFQVNTVTDDPLYLNTSLGPKVAMDDQGRFVVVWTQDNENEDDALYYRRFDADGVALDVGQVEVFTESLVIGFYDVALEPSSGDFVIAWRDRSNSTIDLSLRRYDSDGIPLGDFSMQDLTDLSELSMAVTFAGPEGAFVVAWNASGGTGPAVQRFTAPVVPGERRNLGNEGHFTDILQIGLAGKADGDFSAVWADDSSETDDLAIFGQRTVAALFADGFESGSPGSWTNQEPPG